MPSLSGIIATQSLYGLLDCPIPGWSENGFNLLKLAQKTGRDHLCQWVILEPSLEKFLQEAGQFSDVTGLRARIEALGLTILNDAGVQAALAEVGQGGELLEALYAGYRGIVVLAAFPGLFRPIADQVSQTYGVSVELWGQKTLTDYLGWSDADVKELLQDGSTTPPIAQLPIAQPPIAQPPIAQSITALLRTEPNIMTMLLPWLLAQLLFLTRQTDFPSISTLQRDLAAESALAATIDRFWDIVRGLIEVPTAMASPVFESSPQQRGVATQHARSQPSKQIRNLGNNATPQPGELQFVLIEPVNRSVRGFETPQQLTTAADSDINRDINTDIRPVRPAPNVIQAELLTNSPINLLTGLATQSTNPTISDSTVIPITPPTVPIDNTPSSNIAKPSLIDPIDPSISLRFSISSPISIVNPFATDNPDVVSHSTNTASTEIPSTDTVSTTDSPSTETSSTRLPSTSIPASLSPANQGTRSDLVPELVPELPANSSNPPSGSDTGGNSVVQTISLPADRTNRSSPMPSDNLPVSELKDGSDGRQVFDIRPGDRRVVITNFGGVGEGTTPSQATIDQVDTLNFIGGEFSPQNMLLTQIGSDLTIQFELLDLEIVLQGFRLENLDNFLRPAASVDLANILLSEHRSNRGDFDIFDVFNADSQSNQLFNPNSTTFLNELDNYVMGFDNSNDVINGQGGNDTLLGLGGDDILRGGDGNDLLAGGAGNNQLVGNGGSDIFVISTHGTSIVSDFNPRIDRIGLPNGVQFDQLQVVQGSGSEATDSWIRLNAVDLMRLKGVAADLLTADSFVPICLDDSG